MWAFVKHVLTCLKLLLTSILILHSAKFPFPESAAYHERGFFSFLSSSILLEVWEEDQSQKPLPTLHLKGVSLLLWEEDSALRRRVPLLLGPRIVDRVGS